MKIKNYECRIKNYRRGNPCGYPFLWDKHILFSSMAGGGGQQCGDSGKMSYKLQDTSYKFRGYFPIMRTLLCLFFLFIISNLFSDGQTINSISITGAKNIKTSEIRKQIKNQPLPFLERILFWRERPAFSPVLINQDIDNISRFVQSNGFLYAEVNSIITEGRKGRMKIEYVITENHPVKIDNVILIINDTLRVERAILRPDIRTLFRQRWIQAQPDKIFKDDYIYHDIEFINSIFLGQGYLKTNTDFKIELVEDSLKVNSTVNITYNTNLERLYYFYGAELLGNRNVDGATVANQIAFRDSMVYRAEYIDRTRENLMRLGVFRSIQIYPNFIGDTQYVYPTLRFIEKQKWVTTGGVGWGNEERFRSHFQVSHHGMYKKADQQHLSIRTSEYIPWNIQFRLIQPAFFHPRINLTINPYLIREDQPQYLLDRYGSVTDLSYMFFTDWNANFSYTFEQVNMKEMRIRADDIDFSSLYNQSIYSTRLDINYAHPKINPYRGFHLISSASVTEIGFDNLMDYYSLSQEIRYYQPISNYFILALRGQVQTIDELQGFPSVPIESRLHLGGINSVRGYGRRTIGPYSMTDEGSKVYIGGRSSTLLTAEARIPIINNFNIALLYDAGNVSNSSYNFNSAHLSQSLGFGLRYISPIGIIRADVARALETDNSYKFYLTIGESF